MQEDLRNAMMAIRGIKIPEFPKEVTELDAEIKSRFASAQKIVAIIERNTTISGEVIRLANLPVMKAATPVKTIREAVSVMGLSNLYNLVVIAAFKRMFSGTGLHRDISDHSVDVAFCMAILSESVAEVTRDEAYLVGLFHNAGSLMLASKDEDAYSKLFRSGLSNPVKVLEQEEAVFNTNHAMVGLLVGKKWQLPTYMLNVILLHHSSKVSRISDDKVRTFVAMLKVANALVAEISLGAYIGEEMQHFLQDGVEELMLDSADLTELRNHLLTEG